MKTNLKKLALISSLVSVLALNSLNAKNIDENEEKAKEQTANIPTLQGTEQGDACGAALCLAGGMMGGECASYVQKYFRLEPWERPGFLAKCPKQ